MRLEYDAFLLRIWPRADRTPWVALENTLTGERQHLADLDALLVFLKATCQPSRDGSEPPGAVKEP
jgi:hypothetical protein